MRLERLPNGDFLERIAISIKYDGHKTSVTEPEEGDRPLDPETMTPLQKAMVQGMQYSRMMESGGAATLTELAGLVGGERTFVYHSLELVNLAPDIQRAIVCGRIPDGFRGYSGGNTNRPALKHLKADIEDGKVDVVVVYKIDRLSRSIYDFAELFQLFEKHHVEFVSVTQDINTATSAGRMMLNILMSFAQYEREIITERIKDKVAAAKKKGMHTGGFPPVGYASNPRTHKLEIVPEQAEVIRRIFREYIEKGSAKDVAISLAADGIRTPVWTSSRGQAHGGKEYSMAQIYAILSNPLYIGKVRHYDKTYPGEQPPIVAQDVWDSVQTTLAANKCSDGRRHVRITPMRGLFKCGYCGGVLKEACRSTRWRFCRARSCTRESASR